MDKNGNPRVITVELTWRELFMSKNTVGSKGLVASGVTGNNIPFNSYCADRGRKCSLCYRKRDCSNFLESKGRRL